MSGVFLQGVLCVPARTSLCSHSHIFLFLSVFFLITVSFQLFLAVIFSIINLIFYSASTVLPF